MLYSALPKSAHELVELRPIVEADLSPWYEYLAMPVVYEHTSWNLRSPSDLASYAEELSPATEDSAFRLAAVLRSSGELVGTVGFHSVSARDRRAELAYDLAPHAWGKGLATYLATLLVGWAHAHAGIARVQATVLLSNVRSAAVLARCGFEWEGILRSYRMVRGQPGDFGMYAHLGSQAVI